MLVCSQGDRSAQEAQGAVWEWFGLLTPLSWNFFSQSHGEDGPSAGADPGPEESSGNRADTLHQPTLG